MDLINLTSQKFISFLKKNNIYKFYFVFDSKTKKVLTSHQELSKIAEYIQTDKRDFLEHEGMFFELDKEYDVILGAFIHKTNRGQAAGGVRFWSYQKIQDYFSDGLRLAKGMTRKNALAGLWWGGGKGVILHNDKFDKYSPEYRDKIYQKYGSFISSLNGCYVTAEDVGTNVNDMANIFKRTRFTTCIPFELGGSGNPSIPTARGVKSGIQATLDTIYNTDLKDKTIAVQGLGNVGTPLIKFLLSENVKKIIACDINEKNVLSAKKMFKDENVEIFQAAKGDNSILFKDCDIVSPCAVGAILNSKTIPNIKAKIICGAANNQLEDSEKDSELLHEKGIYYIPDFLVNRMGIVNCSNEQYGYLDNDELLERHLSKEWKHSIHQTIIDILKTSKQENESTAKISIEIADKLSNENHPIFGHRSQRIINSLVKNEWHN